jgi:3-deoxy-manno-octulosonate cytidylyltransferase (CMP-KDO synthetase)
MAKILGMPMIGHVYHRSKMCSTLEEVYVATCDEVIAEYIQKIGGQSVMTADTHERAADRVAEAFLKIEKYTGKEIDIIVLLQGDEPMIVPEMIEASIRPLIDDSFITVSNLMAFIENEADFEDPNEVKVVIDNHDFALYFSREPIPSRKKYDQQVTMFKQVCVIPFRRSALLKFYQLEPTILEIIESVDMNRFLEHGIKVKMIKTEFSTVAVDTPNDLERVADLMKDDQLLSEYG